MDADPENPKALLSLRSALVLVTSLIVAAVAGWLTYAAHHSPATAALAAGGAFAAAAAFLNWVIQLGPRLEEKLL